jgi:hypothetical protein
MLSRIQHARKKYQCMILESVYWKHLEHSKLKKEIMTLHKLLLFAEYETGFEEGKETFQKVIKGKGSVLRNAKQISFK